MDDLSALIPFIANKTPHTDFYKRSKKRPTNTQSSKRFYKYGKIKKNFHFLSKTYIIFFIKN